MKNLYRKGMSQGFTLIELLVVVAIIGILAAILFPVFARARENARRASCMSNLKQQGLAIMQYTQDYDEKYPPVWTGWTSVDNVWIGELQPYIKNTDVYFCSSDTASDDDSSASSNGATLTNRSIFWWVNHVSYGWNVSGLTQIDSLGHYIGISMAALDNASEIVMMADNGGKKVNSTSQYQIQCYSPLTLEPKDTVTAPSRIHLGGGNFAFADGHVKWSKIPNPFLNNTFCNTPEKRKINWNY